MEIIVKFSLRKAKMGANRNLGVFNFDEPGPPFLGNVARPHTEPYELLQIQWMLTGRPLPGFRVY